MSEGGSCAPVFGTGLVSMIWILLGSTSVVASGAESGGGSSVLEAACGGVTDAEGAGGALAVAVGFVLLFSGRRCQIELKRPP